MKEERSGHRDINGNWIDINSSKPNDGDLVLVYPHGQGFIASTLVFS